ncbi:uncharacterized protein LOC115739809 [Rhodamnia argentea]|uniref:Uncharacterized protein LOC115739809 n=1 Tax=Rhodamnia argentea TaxID=178133 RepID=A0A8B8P287_9MYRT|nr:uncharacterized protein LOC115739809 [Rhodamnia argentea]
MLDPARRRNDLKLSDHIQVFGDGALDYGSRARKTAGSYASHRAASQTNMCDFHGGTDADEDSGVCTPPLWRSSPLESPRGHHGSGNHYRSLSPASRTQAIARGQMELMEMVRNMPESCYELSLKDLVELPRARQELDTMAVIQSDGSSKRQNSNSRVEGSNNKGHIMARSGSIDNGGFLLKMMFPIPWGSSKKKRDNSGNNFRKVSPRPSMDGPARVGVEEEWWKKRNHEPGDSEIVDSSVNAGSMKSSGSSSSSSRCNSLSSSKRHGDGGCCSFLWTKKTEPPK